MAKEIIVDEKREQERKQHEHPKDDLQQKLLLYRILQSHLEQIRKEAELIERNFIAVESTKQLLGDMGNSAGETDILLPVGNGIFAKAKLTDRKLLMDIGAGVMAKKSMKEVEVSLDQAKAEIEETVKKLNNDMSETVTKMNALVPELQKLSR